MFGNLRPLVILLILSHSACEPASPVLGPDAVGGVGSIGDYALSLKAPFAPTDPHVITRGYSTGPTHVGSDVYALDFAGAGCSTSMRPVLAPWAGEVVVPTYSDGYGHRVRVYSAEAPSCYFEVAHCETVTATDGQYVIQGQELCLEGNTGNTTGSSCPDHPGAHIHAITRCDEVAVRPEPMEGLTNISTETTVTSTNTPLGWLPDGTLAKTSSSPDVFVKHASRWHLIDDEEAFWALGYDFADVVTTGLHVFECDGQGATLTAAQEVRCFADEETWQLWILDPLSSTGFLVNEDLEWTTVMESWGLDPWGACTGTADDLAAMTSSAVGRLRDGTLVKEATSSAVYVISGGIAWPIETWSVLEAAGWGDRTILEVADGVLDDLTLGKGDCFHDSYCLTEDTLRTCGTTAGGGWEPEDSDGDGFAMSDGDCNDARADVHPGAAEACDGVDNDCDGEADEGCGSTSTDADSDGLEDYTEDMVVVDVGRVCLAAAAHTWPADTPSYAVGHGFGGSNDWCELDNETTATADGDCFTFPHTGDVYRITFVAEGTGSCHGGYQWAALSDYCSEHLGTDPLCWENSDGSGHSLCFDVDQAGNITQANPTDCAATE